METRTPDVFFAVLAPLETKYRDIADGNDGEPWVALLRGGKLETKYRDIADGNIALLVVSPVW